MNRQTLEAVLPNAGKGRKGKLFLSKNCFSPGNAVILYQYLKLSLLDVNNWNSRKTGISVNAKLMDRHGRPVGRIAQVGDRIKIMLSRWQSLIRIFNWFEIRKIEERLSENIEFFFITVAPSCDPGIDFSDAPGFQKLGSTVTIFIIHDEHKIDLQIHTGESNVGFQGDTWKGKLRNLVNVLFIHSGYYKQQWAKLLRSLLEEGSSNFTNLN